MARQIEATHAWMEVLIYQSNVMEKDQQMLKLGGPIALLKAQSTQTMVIIFLIRNFVPVKRLKFLEDFHIRVEDKVKKSNDYTVKFVGMLFQGEVKKSCLTLVSANLSKLHNLWEQSCNKALVVMFVSG